MRTRELGAPPVVRMIAGRASGGGQVSRRKSFDVRPCERRNRPTKALGHGTDPAIGTAPHPLFFKNVFIDACHQPRYGVIGSCDDNAVCKTWSRYTCYRPLRFSCRAEARRSKGPCVCAASSKTTEGPVAKASGKASTQKQH
jgi:hypothetical protein